MCGCACATERRETGTTTPPNTDSHNHKKRLRTHPKPRVPLWHRYGHLKASTCRWLWSTATTIPFPHAFLLHQLTCFTETCTHAGTSASCSLTRITAPTRVLRFCFRPLSYTKTTTTRTASKTHGGTCTRLRPRACLPYGFVMFLRPLVCAHTYTLTSVAASTCALSLLLVHARVSASLPRLGKEGAGAVHRAQRAREGPPRGGSAKTRKHACNQR